MSVLFYSALHLSFVKLLFHLQCSTCYYLTTYRTAGRLLTYCTVAVHWSLQSIEVCAPVTIWQRCWLADVALDLPLSGRHG